MQAKIIETTNTISKMIKRLDYLLYKYGNKLL